MMMKADEFAVLGFVLTTVLVALALVGSCVRATNAQCNETLREALKHLGDPAAAPIIVRGCPTS